MSRSNYRGIFVAAVLLIVGSAIAVAAIVWRLRQDAIGEAVHETSNIAAIIAEQVAHSTQSVEIVLDEVLSEVTRRGVTDPDTAAERLTERSAHDFLRHRLARLPQADVMTITGADGRVLAITRAWPTPEVDLSDREYFQYLAREPGTALYVSAPVPNKITGTWVVYFAKRLEAPGGRFLGIAMVGVRPENFLSGLQAVSSAPDRVLRLLRSDGTVLLRYPNVVGRIGDKLPGDSEWYGLVDAGGGSYRTRGLILAEPRWISVMPLKRQPLVVDVSVTEAQALAGWRTRAATIAAVTTLAASVFLLLLGLLFRQIRRLHVSEAELAEKSREIGLANTRFAATLASMSHGIAMFDRDGRLLIHNRKYAELLGFDPADLGPNSPAATMCAACPTCDLGSGSGPSGDECTVAAGATRHAGVRRLADGRWVQTTVDPMPDGGWVTTHEDITSARKAQERIAHLAHFDALTELANRTLFMQHIRDTHAAGSRDCALLLLDLDHFKEVNDGFGHGVGDRLLCEVAERLRGAVRAGDLVARLGGDEFAIVFPLDGTGIVGLERLADRLVGILGAPYSVEGHDLTIGVSIGVSLVHPDPTDPESVMRQADLALYRAKSAGRNRWRLFEPEMEEEYRARQGLIADLQQAIAHDELALHYQPIVDTATLEIRTMEALVRWNHPEHGWIPPSRFVPLAEEAGLIQTLGEWVLRRACREACDWAESVRVAVNVSTLQIGQPTFVDLVARVLRDTGFAARRLQLEITESVLLSDAARAVSIFDTLHEMGIAIVLDDFGTGYSSLSYLKRFAFDEVKIDKSFVDDVAGHRGCAAIVSATISLAREFDMVTTAEGVETREQFDLLRAAAVTQMQGWLFGRAAPASAWNLADRSGVVRLPVPVAPTAEEPRRAVPAEA